jgi:acyl transferase domain-containing protein
MISMAMEAVKQLTDSSLKITGFNVKNVHFMSALVIPAGTPSIDTRFSLHPHRDNGPENGGWYEFSLFSKTASWNKHSVGSIQAVVDKDGNTEVPAGHSEILAQFHQMNERSTTSLDRTLFYESLKSSGLQFGPLFKSILTIASNQDDDLVTEIQTYTSEGPEDWNERYTIHPTTLDGLMQSTQVLRSKGGQKRIPPSIPTRIDRAWLSNTGLCSPQTSSIKVGTKLQHVGRQESKFALMAVSQDTQNVLIAMEGVTFTAIDSHQTSNEASGALERSKCHRIEWKPDLDLSSQVEIIRFFENNIPGTTSQAFDHMCMDLMIGGFISRTVNAIGQNNQVFDIHAEAQSYVGWLRSQMQLIQAGNSPFSSTYWQSQIQDDATFERICDSVETSSAQGRLVVNVGRTLLKHAHSGFESPLSGIVNQELLRVSYEEVVSS